ncbi:MAG: HD-GYP domain-containing protein [Usitatibacteraceae bacterium]
MHQKIATKDLKQGMFIADLDRPWIDTPFLLQGFLLEDHEQLQQLRQHCQWVMIDPARSVGGEFDKVAKKAPPAPRAGSGDPRVSVQHVQRPTSGASRTGPTTTGPARNQSPPPSGQGAGRGTASTREFAVAGRGGNSALGGGDGRLAPSASARNAKTEKNAGPSSGRGIWGIWGNLREGVTGIFGKRETEQYEDDSVPNTAAPEEIVHHSFIPASVQLMIYEDMTAVEAEIGAASESFKRTSELLHSLADDIRAGDDLKLEEIESVIDDMVESMVRNPDALMWVARMREQDLNIYSHGISVAVNLVAFGRHLGYPKAELSQLGMLGLLLDVGQIKLPRDLLEKNERLTADEFETIKEHVDLGLAVLSETPNIHPDVMEGIAQHHERMNGSGYPRNLMGEKISTFGRMAAIADTYAAVTKPRPYADVISPHHALQMLTTWSGSQFQADMVEQFIQSIGVFPVGSMVELSTGEVAIVVTHSKFKRLRPKVLILTEPNKAIRTHPSTLDLLYDVSDSPVYIRAGLPSKAYGIDPRDYYAA